MRVTERSAAAGMSGASGTQRASGTGQRFSLGGAESAARPAGVQAAAPMDSMAGLLAVQAAGDAVERRRRALRRGRGLLDGLDALKVALLSGSVPAGQLESLRGQLRARSEAADDPALADLLAHIELRAEVELAKLGKA